MMNGERSFRCVFWGNIGEVSCSDRLFREKVRFKISLAEEPKKTKEDEKGRSTYENYKAEKQKFEYKSGES